MSAKQQRQLHNAQGIPKHAHTRIGQQLHCNTALQYPSAHARTHTEREKATLTDIVSEVNCYITTTQRASFQPPSVLSNWVESSCHAN